MEETLDSVYRHYRDGSSEQRALLHQVRGYLQNSRTVLRLMQRIAMRVAEHLHISPINDRLQTEIRDAYLQLGFLLSGHTPESQLTLAWLTLSVGRITTEMYSMGLMNTNDQDDQDDYDSDDGIPDYGRGERGRRTQAMRDLGAEALALNEHVLNLVRNATQVEQLMRRLVATGAPEQMTYPPNSFLVIQNPGHDEDDWLQFAAQPRQPVPEDDSLQLATPPRQPEPDWVNAPMVGLGDPGGLDAPYPFGP